MLGIVDKAIDLIRVPENDVQAIIALAPIVMSLVMGCDAASYALNNPIYPEDLNPA